MSVVANPSVVTSGLVLCLDTTNRRSYPGTGSILYDVSGNGINMIDTGFGTFPTYQSGDSTLSFSSNYIGNNTAQSPLNITNNITVEVWVNQSTLVNHGGILVFGSALGEQWSLNSNSTSGFEFGTNWPSTWYLTSPTVGSATAVNTWISVSLSFASGTTIWYVNGTLNQSIAQGISSLTSVSNAFVGMGNNFPGGFEYFSGKMSVVRVYNRVLTAAEISQNFNAMRGRYGI
jgi:hypothetical protein